MLFGPLFGEDLNAKLGLPPWKAFGGHFRTDGTTVSLTIRIAPEWEIGGHRVRRFPDLPYTAKPYQRKAKLSKPENITSKPEDVQEYLRANQNAIVFGVDIGLGDE